MTAFNDPWRERAAQVRDGSLEPLAVQLGYRQDPANPARWKRPGSVLSIRGSQFFDHRPGRGGGGGIDLVMQVRFAIRNQALKNGSRQIMLAQLLPRQALEIDAFRGLVVVVSRRCRLK